MEGFMASLENDKLNVLFDEVWLEFGLAVFFLNIHEIQPDII